MKLPFEITYEILKMVVFDKLRTYTYVPTGNLAVTESITGSSITYARNRDCASECTDLLGEYACGLFLAEFFPERDKSGRTNSYCAYEAFEMITRVKEEIRALMFYYDTVKYSITDNYGSLCADSRKLDFLAITHPRDLFDLCLFLYKDKFKLEPK